MLECQCINLHSSRATAGAGLEPCQRGGIIRRLCQQIVSEFWHSERDYWQVRGKFIVHRVSRLRSIPNQVETAINHRRAMHSVPPPPPVARRQISWQALHAKSVHTIIPREAPALIAHSAGLELELLRSFYCHLLLCKLPDCLPRHPKRRARRKMTKPAFCA